MKIDIKELSDKISKMQCDEYQEGLESLIESIKFLQNMEDEELAKIIKDKVEEMIDEYEGNCVEVQYAEVTFRTDETEKQLKKKYPEAINIRVYTELEE